MQLECMIERTKTDFDQAQAAVLDINKDILTLMAKIDVSKQAQEDPSVKPMDESDLHAKQ
jgi:hypothetical protein